MSNVDKQFDSVLLSLAQHCDEDVTQLMDLFFGFLARKTDFFVGQRPEQSREQLLEAFQQQWGILDELTKKKLQERVELEQRREAIRKRQLELEKAKEAELISQQTEKNVTMKTVEEYEKEQPPKPEPEPEPEMDSTPDDLDKENSMDTASSGDQQPPKRPKAPEESPEEKEKREKEAAIEKTRLMPNAGNGCDLPNYSWTQTFEQVEISVPLRAGVPLKARDVVVEMSSTHLKVGVRGRDPIVDGDLFDEVAINEEATWMLVDRTVVNVILPKKKRTEYWKKLITTDPEVSTKKMTTEAMNFTDLEEDHKAVVEKMMYDSRQKEMGLPTSEEKKKLDIIAKIKKINPNLNIDPSQLQMPGDSNNFSFGGNGGGFNGGGFNGPF